jgi:predicted nucleic-acid-binding protein
VKITADTNILIRVLTRDNPRQSKAAEAALQDAELVALTPSSLCELVWVLSSAYKRPLAEIAEAIRGLINAANTVVNRPAVEAGLALMDAGGDFADGVIAYEGRWLGAETFISFDKQAALLLANQGQSVRLLS